MSKVVATAVINRNAVKAIIGAIKNGTMFGVTFERRNPKCKSCGRTLKSFHGKTHCHMCGGELSFEATSVAQKGVHKADKEASRGGRTAKQAERDYNLLQFYNVNADKKQGGYRSCGFDEIKSIRSNGVEYIVQ